MKLTKHLYAIATAAALSGLSCQTADAGPTLDRVQSSGRIVVGVREGAQPFSNIEADGTPRGYTVEICKRIVEGMERDLKRKLAVQYRPVTAANRFEMVKNGAIDMECGSSTHTAEREREVAFTYPFFVTGVRLAVTKGSPIKTHADLQGLRVAVVPHSTGARVVQSANIVASAANKGFSIITVASNADGIKAVATGQADAFATDDVLLSGAIAAAKLNGKIAVVGRYMSVEPYAVMVAPGDKDFMKLIDSQLITLYRNGEAVALITKWFDTPELNYPVNYLTREAISLPVKQAAYP